MVERGEREGERALIMKGLHHDHTDNMEDKSRKGSKMKREEGRRAEERTYTEKDIRLKRRKSKVKKKKKSKEYKQEKIT